MVEILVVLTFLWILGQCLGGLRQALTKTECPVKFNIVTGEVRGMKELRGFAARHPDALARGRERAAKEGVPVHKFAPMMSFEECIQGLKDGLADIDRAERETFLRRKQRREGDRDD